MLLSVPTTRRSRIEVSGKQGKVREAGTTLSPHKLEEVRPVMKVKVNGMDWIALVDSGCSSSIVSGMLCRPEVWKSTAILTAGKKCLLSHGVGSITLTVTNRNPLKTNVLVVNWEWMSSRNWAVCISTKEARHILLRRLTLWV